MSAVRPRIGVLVVAYNAISTLAQTLDRIPAEVMDRLDGVFVFDDHSSDHTYEAALEYKRAKHVDKLTVFHNERNLRYGGNQKRGFRYAIDQGFVNPKDQADFEANVDYAKSLRPGSEAGYEVMGDTFRICVTRFDGDEPVAWAIYDGKSGISAGEAGAPTEPFCP